MSTAEFRMLQRRGTKDAWEEVNPVLHAGEFGYETDTEQLKVGDGTTTWVDLDYLSAGGGAGAVDSVNGQTGEVVLDAGDVGAATAAQGAAADSAVQPADLAPVASSGAYEDLSGTPALGSAAAQDVSAFASADQGLLADSATQPDDLAAAMAAMLSISRGGPRQMRSGLWYGPGAHQPGISSFTANVVRAIPLVVPHAVVADRIGCEVATGTASSTVRLGIYANDPATDLPGALILDAGTVNAAAAGAREITINQALAAGTYWLAWVPQAANATLRTIGNISDPLIGQSAQVTAGNLGANALQLDGGVTGALPGTLTLTSETVSGAKILIRVA